jgi:hypothetical protein
MRSLRILWGFALAGIAWGLAIVCWMVPARANADVPQAPNQQSVLTVVAQASGNQLSLSGTLTSGGQPIPSADVSLTLDSQSLGKTSTGGDGSYSTSTNLPGYGTHVVTATYAGDNKTYRPALATQRFTLAPATSAPATTAPPATTITAQLSPNPVAAGAVLAITGNVSSAGVPVDSSRVDISCDFGGLTALGVTDASGNFSANLSLPSAGQPSKLTVTVNFAGDNRFAAAKGTFQAAVTAASASPSAVASPTIAPESSAPPISTAGATPTVVSSSTMTLQNPSAPITTFEVVLGIVGAGSLTALCVLWILAWQRHYLMPGERRGFGSDFGRRRTSA